MFLFLGIKLLIYLEYIYFLVELVLQHYNKRNIFHYTCSLLKYY